MVQITHQLSIVVNYHNTVDRALSLPKMPDSAGTQLPPSHLLLPPSVHHRWYPVALFRSAEVHSTLLSAAAAAASPFRNVGGLQVGFPADIQVEFVPRRGSHSRPPKTAAGDTSSAWRPPKTGGNRTLPSGL